MERKKKKLPLLRGIKIEKYAAEKEYIVDPKYIKQVSIDLREQIEENKINKKKRREEEIKTERISNKKMNDYNEFISRKKGIHYNPKFDFLNFISNQNEIQNWKIYGLPDDVTMVENAVIMKYSLRPSLIIDPQDQAIDWIKNMLNDTENKPSTDNLEVDNNASQIQGASGSNKKKATSTSLANRKYYECTTSMNAYLANMTKAMRENKTVIINNVGEFLPPDLEEFLKTFDKTKNSLYLRTKAPNPKFGPEVSTSVNIINFLVNDKGLEEQILSTFV